MRNEKGQFVKGNQEGFKKGHISFSKEHRFPKKHIPWNKNKSGYKNSYPENRKPFTIKRGGWKFSKEVGLRMSEKRRGNKHYNWQGGITPLNKKLRNSLEYKIWHKLCFERDNYTCQICGANGVYLEVHHIKPLSLFPELSTDINNGITLCISCHQKTDTYRGKINKIKSEVC